MTLKCLIVDDEPPAVKIIENYLSKLNNVELVGTASNAIEAIEFLKNNAIDILFLDVNMPEVSGINLLKIIKSPPAVILTTAYSEYALESYEHNVTDYLLKPIRFERFITAVEKARNAKLLTVGKNTYTNAPTSFEFKVNGVSKKIDLNEIIYLQSLGNYVKIFTAQKSYVALMTTKEAESFLPKSQFIRIHKSYIINALKVEDHSNEFVEMPGVRLPIGKIYKKYFIESRQ